MDIYENRIKLYIYTYFFWKLTFIYVYIYIVVTTKEFSENKVINIVKRRALTVKVTL